jgi:hypothetical protein
MDMNQPVGEPPGIPELAMRDRRLYFAFLRSQGYPVQVAADMTDQKFGQINLPGDESKQQQKNQLAQVGGQVAGSVGGAILAQQIGSAFMPAAPTAALKTPTLLAVKGLGGAGTGAATGGATAGTAGTTAAGSSLASVGSVALPVAAAIAAASNAWETGMKDIVRGRGDRADWINQGANMVFGAAPNIALRLLGKRSIGAMATSGKSDAQRIRDDFRGDLKEANVADKDYNVTLADGSKFNIGLDGKTKYKNVGENVDGKTTRNAWDVDFSNPLAKFAVDKIDPAIRNIYGADDEKNKYFPSQYTGMLVNAATSNAKTEADVLANIETMLGQSKFAQQAGVGVTPPPPPRPGKGEVGRISPGMYRDDKGRIVRASSTREALERAYSQPSRKKGKK